MCYKYQNLVCWLLAGLAPVSNVIFCSRTDISKIAIYKLYLEKFLALTVSERIEFL